MQTRYYDENSVCPSVRPSVCHTRGSHSFTCHPHTSCTCLYSPAARRNRLGWYSLRLPTKERPGWVNLGGWLRTEINVPHRELNPDTVTYPSTNRARRRSIRAVRPELNPVSWQSAHTQLHKPDESTTDCRLIPPNPLLPSQQQSSTTESYCLVRNSCVNNLARVVIWKWNSLELNQLNARSLDRRRHHTTDTFYKRKLQL